MAIKSYVLKILNNKINKFIKLLKYARFNWVNVEKIWGMNHV